MEWLNLHSSVLDSPEFVGEEPVNQATWLKLQRFCIGQENGGRIEGCREWKDRKWQQLVRVTKREVDADSELWEWDGDDLVVAFYPIEKETEVKTNRSNGKRGGRPRKKTQGKTETGTETKPGGSESVNPTGTERHEIAETEGKGREWKGKEEKGITPLPPEGDPGGNRFLPKGWRQWSTRRQKSERVLANSPTMSRVGRWFGRKPDTLWTVHEGGLLASLRPAEDELDLMEGYYLAVIDGDRDIRRRDLATLLNNWISELDRARAWKHAA